MFESFVTAFIIYFVVIDPIGNAPIFLAVTEAQDRARKLRTALEGTAITTAFMMFFALCGAWILGYLNITEAAFKIAGGIILCLTVIAEGWLNEKITMVFSRITAIILAGLSVQYVIDGLAAIGLVTL